MAASTVVHLTLVGVCDHSIYLVISIQHQVNRHSYHGASEHKNRPQHSAMLLEFYSINDTDDDDDDGDDSKNSNSALVIIRC